MASSERLTLVAPDDAASLAAHVRAQAPVAGDVSADVRTIVRAIREGGDAVLAEHVERLDGGGPVHVTTS